MTWTNRTLLGPVAIVAIVVSACASTNTNFVSSWKAPSAKPLELRGAKVVAVVMMQDLASRRVAEDRLANEITARGAQGIPMYAIMPESSVDDEPKARTALEQAGVQGIVVMRPTGTELQTYVDAEPGYALYWDGYYAHGWGQPWSGESVPSANTTVSIDTRIYSFRQNKLVWAGQSKTTNPASVGGLIAELASATAKQLNALGLIAK